MPGHTEERHAQRLMHTYTHTLGPIRRLTVERWSCENINFIVQGPFVEAGLVRLGVLGPLFPGTERH